MAPSLSVRSEAFGTYWRCSHRLASMVLSIKLSETLIECEVLHLQGRDNNPPVLNLDAHALISMQMRLARNTNR
jgi:hypothetical protein